MSVWTPWIHDVALGSSKDNLNQVLGSVYLGGLNANINGTVDIHTSSPSTQGIVLDLDLSVAMQPFTLSWGDADGVGAGTTAGYRGWRNVEITGLTVSGQVEIEVATVDTTVTPASAEEYMFSSIV